MHDHAIRQNLEKPELLVDARIDDERHGEDEDHNELQHIVGRVVEDVFQLVALQDPLQTHGHNAAC